MMMRICELQVYGLQVTGKTITRNLQPVTVNIL
jgi:hypothetical protein